MEINYKSLAYKIFCWGFFILCAVLFFRYLFPYLFPFIISWAIGYAVYPVAIKLSKRTKISRRICSFALVSFLLILILSIIFLVCNRLIYEIQNLFDYLTDNSDRIAKFIEDAVAFFDNVVDDLPFLSGLQNSELAESIRKNINSLIGNVWESFLDGIGSALPDLAGSIVTALPNILLVSLMVTIASFYFAIDIDSVNRKLKELLPQKWGELLKSVKSRAIDGVVKYLKSYFVIFSITFIELLIGFLILGIDYSFVLAILIAVLDILPVLGTAVVLAPWGILLLLMKNYFLGVGMLILLLIISIVRQIIEPKILGDSFGVHPLVSLITLYIGLKLFGVVGMVLLPMIVMIVLSETTKSFKAK